MKNSSKIRFLVLALTLTMILSLVACGKSRTSIVGTWSSDDGEEVLIFNLIKMVLVLSRLLMMVVGGKAATAILLMMMGRWF